jgi:hypothetical protein
MPWETSEVSQLSHLAPRSFLIMEGKISLVGQDFCFSAQGSQISERKSTAWYKARNPTGHEKTVAGWG